MMRATNTAKKTTTVRQLSKFEGDVLTPADLLKLERIAQLKAELDTLERAVKPRIEATVRLLGSGDHEISGRTVRLSHSIRDSVSWKSIAESGMEPEQIAPLKALYTAPSESFSAKVVA